MFADRHLAGMEQVTRAVCERFGAQHVEWCGEANHAHPLVDFPTMVALSKLVNSLAGTASSRTVRSRARSPAADARVRCHHRPEGRCTSGHLGSAVAFRASPSVPAWPSSSVTVLDDAIHTMPPIGGLGGNTALRDAHLLSRLLAAVARGERDLLGAIAEYEAEMRQYGAAAVRYAMEQKDQLLSTGALGTAAARAFFRLCSTVPALRRRAFAAAWAGPAAPRPWELATETRRRDRNRRSVGWCPVVAPP